ncbi:hypothetical protein GLYMA_08G223500v4 [Glycine max]|uniref:Uncharacterized protein n=1 Tax=Glycine max TaxID=3847 RepID=A0A0R0IQZ0_SOYBN|nr:hypothetical protein JHK85_022575 [Glycine max]KAH1052541.1 hypothetical protein GYH30_022055 [Glycine max]KRH44647.1 hypothetical protein GLYMA_08G223500v4 [Glycine max]
MLGSRLILLLFRGYFLIKEEKLANLILCYKILENFLHSGYANFLITDWVVHLFLLPFCLVSSQLVMVTLILQENITQYFLNPGITQNGGTICWYLPIGGWVVGKVACVEMLSSLL